MRRILFLSCLVMWELRSCPCRRSAASEQCGARAEGFWGVGQLGWGGISEVHPSVKMQRKEMLHGMI